MNTLLKSYYLYAVILSVAVYANSLSAYADTKSKKQDCLVSASTLKKQPLNNTLLIDVRGKQIFSEKHIPSSINIPLQLISTKAFLKNKNVVLIGNGWNESSLIHKCIQLKIEGFKSVKVLAGGVIKGVRLEFINNKSSLTPFIKLTSKEFFNNKIDKNFVPFIITNKTKKQVNTVLPHAKIVSVQATKKQLLNKLKQIGKGNNPIVIFSDAVPTVDAAINDYLRKPLRKIYFFEGGFKTYKKVNDLNKMTALSNQKKRLSTKKPVSCAN